jgi:hypothetical protein
VLRVVPDDVGEIVLAELLHNGVAEGLLDIDGASAVRDPKSLMFGSFLANCCYLLLFGCR